MIKVLGLALYGQLAASTRQRLAQYTPGLSAQGIELSVQHLLGDEYLSRRVFGNGPMPWGALLQSGWERLTTLCARRRYDVLMLHCELFPLMPAWFERFLMRRPYIYDLDDAFYLKYRSGRLRWLQAMLGGKFDSVMRGAAIVTAGSRVISEYAVRHNPQTIVLPTVVDTSRYSPRPRSRSKELVVGWIGSPSTAPYLHQLERALKQLATEGSVRFLVIGGPAPSISGVNVEERPWSEATEIESINAFDVGVMPLPDEPWARGKCAFKLIQYMACGVPVIASPVGANVDVLREGCGLLARSDSEWLDALRTIRDQPEMAEQMSRAGRTRVEQEYSLQRNLPALSKIIRSVAQR